MATNRFDRFSSEFWDMLYHRAYATLRRLGASDADAQDFAQQALLETLRQEGLDSVLAEALPARVCQLAIWRWRQHIRRPVLRAEYPMEAKGHDGETVVLEPAPARRGAEDRAGAAVMFSQCAPAFYERMEAHLRDRRRYQAVYRAVFELAHEQFPDEEDTVARYAFARHLVCSGTKADGDKREADDLQELADRLGKPGAAVSVGLSRFKRKWIELEREAFQVAPGGSGRAQSGL